MKLLKKALASKVGVYGIVIAVISIAVIIFSLLTRESIINEFEKINVEEKCFNSTEPDPEWENMSPEKRKERSDRCMAALNKVTQVKSGPYIFSFTLAVGIFLIVLSIIRSDRNSDGIMEDLEKNDDNQLS